MRLNSTLHLGGTVILRGLLSIRILIRRMHLEIAGQQRISWRVRAFWKWRQWPNYLKPLIHGQRQSMFAGMARSVVNIIVTFAVTVSDVVVT